MKVMATIIGSAQTIVGNARGVYVGVSGVQMSLPRGFIARLITKNIDGVFIFNGSVGGTRTSHHCTLESGKTIRANWEVRGHVAIVSHGVVSIHARIFSEPLRVNTKGRAIIENADTKREARILYHHNNIEWWLERRNKIQDFSLYLHLAGVLWGTPATVWRTDPYLSAGWQLYSPVGMLLFNYARTLLVVPDKHAGAKYILELPPRVGRWCAENKIAWQKRNAVILDCIGWTFRLQPGEYHPICEV